MLEGPAKLNEKYSALWKQPRIGGSDLKFEIVFEFSLKS